MSQTIILDRKYICELLTNAGFDPAELDRDMKSMTEEQVRAKWDSRIERATQIRQSKPKRG
jgi:hypothetical protein